MPRLDIERVRTLGLERAEPLRTAESVCAELDAARNVVAAADAYSAWVSEATTEAFSHGQDKEERETLDSALATYREATR